MNKKVILSVIAGLACLGIILTISLQSKKVVIQKSSETVQTDEDVIPTVGSATMVSLQPLQGKKELKIIVQGIPKGTDVVDYQLSYETKSQGRQGVIGTITSFTNDSLEKQITLGTCSSGRCVYHEVVGTINASLKFTGSYGDRLFEKEFAL